MNTTRKVSTEDRLTRTLTAFRSWSEFLQCMREGYIPTLRNTDACHKLARIIRGNGFDVRILK